MSTNLLRSAAGSNTPTRSSPFIERNGTYVYQVNLFYNNTDLKRAALSVNLDGHTDATVNWPPTGTTRIRTENNAGQAVTTGKNIFVAAYTGTDTVNLTAQVADRSGRVIGTTAPVTVLSIEFETKVMSNPLDFFVATKLTYVGTLPRPYADRGPYFVGPLTYDEIGNIGDGETLFVVGYYGGYRLIEINYGKGPMYVFWDPMNMRISDNGLKMVEYFETTYYRPKHEVPMHVLDERITTIGYGHYMNGDETMSSFVKDVLFCKSCGASGQQPTSHFPRKGSHYADETKSYIIYQGQKYGAPNPAQGIIGLPESVAAKLLLQEIEEFYGAYIN
jgi:hypothetical protein